MRKHINRLGVRTASALAAMVFASQAAWALAPFKVQDIRVEGLQRVEPGTIFASLPLRVGDEYNDDKGAAAIRALFALGLFKDVRLEASGNVLVVVVEERPTIADYAGKSAAMGLAYYLGFLALISVSLGVLNLLPLPVLDGGHLMYYLWEGVTGKGVTDAWMERLQRGGVAVLLVMMTIAIFNDVTRLLG